MEVVVGASIGDLAANARRQPREEPNKMPTRQTASRPSERERSTRAPSCSSRIGRGRAVNDPRGVARILKVHTGDGGDKKGGTTYEVKYVIKSHKERGMEEWYMLLHRDYI